MKNLRVFQYVWLLPIFLLLGIPQAGAQETPFAYYTGFEPDESPPFTIGPLPQNEWNFSGDGAEITGATPEVYSGKQALTVGPQSTVDKDIDGSGASVVWLEGWYKTTPEPEYPNLADLEAGSSLVLFHSDQGIMCLDGNLDNGGIWRATGVQANAADWHRITIRQDYTQQKWDCYVDGYLRLQNLGFKNPINRLSGFRIQQGENSGGFLDEFAVQTDPLIPPFTPYELFRFSKTWRWQRAMPTSDFDETMYRNYNRIRNGVIDEADLLELMKAWLLQ